MSKRVREIMRRVAEQKEQMGIFYPMWFSDYADAIPVYVTCPNCTIATLHETPWKNVTRSWAGASFETACPSCSTVVTACLSAHPGGRQGEVQYEIVEASWDSITRTRGLASKPPVHLFADAPSELPAFRRFAWIPDLWLDETWWEVKVPGGWAIGPKPARVFLSPYGGDLSLQVNKRAGLGGYGHLLAPQEIQSPEERTAFLMTRSNVDIAFGASVPLSRHELGPLAGFWGAEHKDGMSSGQGYFSCLEWMIHASLRTPTKNFAYHWGVTQRIIGSIAFHAQ